VSQFNKAFNLTKHLAAKELRLRRPDTSPSHLTGILEAGTLAELHDLMGQDFT
jgi:hypothetical protein